MPTLGLRGPPPSQPVPRSTGEQLVLGWRLPSLVAPPPEGALRLIPLAMRVPCHIAVDPRLCKGSVFAEKRRRVAQTIEVGEESKKETKYRVNVLRSRLETSLPQVPVPGQRPKNGYTNGFIPSARPRVPPLKQKSLSPRMPIQLPQLTQQHSAASIDKGFRKMKFVPLTNTTNLEDRHQRKLPSRVVPALGRVRVHKTKVVDEAPTPPCSERKEYPIVESAVQTDDMFDDETAKLVADLALTAINQALFNLEQEEKLLGLEKKTESFRQELEREKRQKREIEKRAMETIEMKEKEIEERKRKEEEVMFSNRLAMATCKELTEKALQNCKKLDEEQPKTRSIGMDTRHLRRQQMKLDLMQAELDKDFIPWLFARAERKFRQEISQMRLEKEEYTKRSV